MLHQQIHNYKIISLLGEGGMANVYLAENQVLGNKVAVKILKEEYVQHPNIRKRFIAEARNLAKMNHPNVIKVTDLIDAGDIVAFVMEYIDGQTLEKYIEEKGKLSDSEIESFFNQMIASVEYIHSQGFIHRDIKPSNFMITKNNEIKLLDFGIAKNINDGAVDYTKTGLMQQMGTPLYMSPEQIKNTSEVTKRTDIYSLGVVLWQMVMGKKPYDTDVLSLPEIQVAILKESLPLTNTVWDEIIVNLLKKEPENRTFSFTNKKNLFLSSSKDFETKKNKSRVRKEKLVIFLCSLVVLISFVIAYSFFYVPKNPNKLENDLFLNNLKGKVKTIISIEDPRFYKVLNYRELKKEHSFEEYSEYDDCINAKVEYDTSKYDLHGNLIYHCYQRLNPFGIKTDFDELYIQKYQNDYDNENRLIAVMKSSSGTSYRMIRKLSYDNGYLIQDNRIVDGQGNQKLSYNKNGNLISKVSLDKKNNQYFKEVFEYNKKGLCIKMAYKSEKTKKGGSHFFYYDSSNNLIRRVQRYENTTIEERYNVFGDKTYEKTTDNHFNNGEFIKYNVYHYLYDQKNNWIKRSCKSYFGYNFSSLSSEIENVIKRQITYY